MDPSAERALPLHKKAKVRAVAIGGLLSSSLIAADTKGAVPSAKSGTEPVMFMVKASK